MSRIHLLVAGALFAGAAVTTAPTLAQDVFDASPKVYHIQRHGPEKTPEKADHPSWTPSRASGRRGTVVDLHAGEIVQVLSSSTFANPELALYLPPEATSVAQVVIEHRGLTVNYFIKGLRRGSTVGGAVARSWLDGAGFHPRNVPDESRIQAAVKKNPLFIEVH
jgi:hypothetical protein